MAKKLSARAEEKLREEANREFFAALDMLENEYKLDKEQLIASIESGLASAYKKENGEARCVVVTLNQETNMIRYMAYYKVIEGDTPEHDYELTVEEAQDIKPGSVAGDIISEEVTPLEFSRVAAQTAKQVIQQRINEIKREQIMAEMTNKEGELMQAVVLRIENDTVYVQIVGTLLEGVMGKQDQVYGETYKVNDKFKVYIKHVRTNAKGATQVLVSRSCAGFVKKLFEMEVPELKSGLVQVKNIVREAGFRTKMSVYSDDPNVDALGSCIGAKGVRVNAIVNELNGEKIDVIPYTPEPFEYIVRALSPAKVLMVQYNEQENQAVVVVADEKLSLAIGKGGQNARLAARLTGIKIDVKPYSAMVSAEEGAEDDNK